MMLMVGPLCVKIRHSDINTTVIENFAISSGAKTILPSVLDFWQLEDENFAFMLLQ